MFVHLCRKVVYGLDVSYRICAYILGTLMISVVSDYKTPTAKRLNAIILYHYLSPNTDNVTEIPPKVNQFLFVTVPCSRSYFANSDNILNQWFVKLGWFWTGLLVANFIYWTSNTYR